jgi:O-antigen/teichoic acid export membrane protein
MHASSQPAAGPATAPQPAALGGGALGAAAGMALVHGVNWAFTIVAARLLEPAGYGELASLIALVVAGSVPAMALQAVVARHVVLRERAGLPMRPLLRGVSRWAGWLAAGLAAATVAAAPLLTAFLHLGSAVPVVWLAVNVALLPALFAVQGLLQGRERFWRLTLLLLASAAVKLAGGVGLLAAGLGVSGAMAGTAVGSLAALLLGLAMVRPAPRREPAGAASGPPAPATALGGELRAAAVSLAGLMTLANLDLLLARHYLPAAASGLYAAGSVLVKVAYWAPQSLVTVIFPRLAARQGDRLAGGVAAAVLALTAALAAGSALVIVWPALLPFGAAYAAVGADLPRFALLGGCLALVQLACFSGIATADRRLHLLVAAAAAVEAALIAAAFHRSVTAIVTTALVVDAALLAAGRAVLRARPGGQGVEETSR